MLDYYDYINPAIDYFVERKCSNAWNLSESEIDFNDLTYVISGEATYVVNGTTYALEKGSLIYIPKGSSRKAFSNPGNPMHCYAFNFQLSMHEGSNISLPFPTLFKISAYGRISELCRELSHIWLEKGPGYMLKARAVFMLVLHELLYQVSEYDNPMSDRRIEQLKEYILHHYNEELNIRKLAELVNLNPVYLGSLFKKNTGCPLKHYVNLIRIRKAEELLSTGGYTVAEAASQCGFDNIFYFSKVFKDIRGISPSTLLK